jgi:DNA-binding HxlR family transcriptional regulator
MTVGVVDNKPETREPRARAGTFALSLLTSPLNVHTLKVLGEEPRPLIDLRRAVGSPPPTTMRANLRNLTEIGILERHRHDDFPGAVDYELARPGRDLLAVADRLQAWLAMSPEGPLLLGGSSAKSAIRALVGGWSSAIVRALAARPFSLTELSKLIPGLTYPMLERRLGAMRLAGQIKACPDRSRHRPYRAAGWLRRAMAPIAAASSWERQHVPAMTARFGPVDIETAFLLAVPPLDLPAEITGKCRLVAEFRDRNGDPALAGVMVGVEEGRVTSCFSRLEGPATSSASGRPTAWFRAVLERDEDLLDVGGDPDLVLALLDGLHRKLAQGGEEALSAAGPDQIPA